MKTTLKFLARGIMVFALVATSCSKDSVEGPIGPVGLQGEQGIQGEKGEQGISGEGIGIPGEKGDQGAQGPEGPQGSQGENGSTGPAGPKGDTGAPGPEGDTATGPMGPKGDTGATGPSGQDGNANATLYEYEGHDFAANFTKSLLLTVSRLDFETTAWFVYLVEGRGSTYPIPGFGPGVASEYQVAWIYTKHDQANFDIKKISGPGESYENIRIIGIKMGTVTPGGKVNNTLPDIDFTDYHAVCDYYGLKY